MYPDEQILKSKIELLNMTNTVDFAMDIHKSLHHTKMFPSSSLFSLCNFHKIPHRFSLTILSLTSREVFEFDETIAMESHTIEQMVEDDYANNAIPLPNSWLHFIPVTL